MENQLFSVLEVLKIAISLEEDGVKFYNEFAEKAEGETKEILLKLAKDEEQHTSVFQAMYNKLEDVNKIDDYLFSEEIDAFFHSYVKDVAFQNILKENSTVEQAISFAINTEKESIEYYEKLLEYAHKDVKEVLERLIEEEKKHKKILENCL